jgi:peptidoglycan/xylan/chitin deacetylase (PgdA/CDA1 family)
VNRLLTWVLRAVGVALYVLRLHPLVIRLHRRDPKVVAYHAFDEVETEYTRGLGVNTTPAALARHLDYLQRHYRVVPLDALADVVPPEGSVAITIDDGYRSVYDGAFPQLRSRGLPATVFLIGDAMGESGAVWTNELNRQLQRPAGAAAAAAALGCAVDAGPGRIMWAAIANFEAGRVARAIEAARAAAAAPASGSGGRLFLTWAEVEAMAAHGITFGNHTGSHPNLARLSPEAQRAEIASGARALAGRPGARTDLALPFGLGGETAAAAARDAGCRLVLGLGGVNAGRVGPVVARVPMASESEAVFFADLEVVTPVKAFLKRVLGTAA